MTLSSAIDREISNKEMQFIQTCINNLPIFKTYNSEDLEKTLSMFFELLSGDNDPETIIELIDQSLDKKTKHIAYALSMEIMMVEENFTNEKLRLLELFEKKQKGELTVVISERKINKNISQKLTESDMNIIKKMINKLSTKEITEILSQSTNVPKKDIYNYCLELKNEK